MTFASPSTINASKGMAEVLTYTNTVSNNWFSNMILIAIWIIVLMGYYKAKNDFAGAMAVAGYGTFVVSLFFWIAGFITGWAFGIVIAVMIVGTTILMLDK